MTVQSAKELAPGIYRLYWATGSGCTAGYSIAAVGILHDGRRWFAPTNWTSVAPLGIASTNWRWVARAEPIEVAP